MSNSAICFSAVVKSIFSMPHSLNAIFSNNSLSVMFSSFGEWGFSRILCVKLTIPFNSCDMSRRRVFALCGVVCVKGDRFQDCPAGIVGIIFGVADSRWATMVCCLDQKHGRFLYVRRLRVPKGYNNSGIFPRFPKTSKRREVVNSPPIWVFFRPP